MTGLRRGVRPRCPRLDALAAAVVLSTHVGRHLDGVVPVPPALPDVVESVGVHALLAELTDRTREAFALAGCPGCADVGPDLVRRRG